MSEEVELLEVDNNSKKIANNKKDKKSMIVIALIAVLILALVIAYFFLDVKKRREYKYKNIKYSEDISLNANYQFNVIVNIDNYLSANEKLVSKLKNNESIKIEASKIVTIDIYNTCSGDVIVTKLGDSYDYSFDTNCGTEDDVELRGINDVVSKIAQVDDGIMVVSYNAPSYDERKLVSGIKSLTITYYDSLGNIKWTDVYNNNLFIKGNTYLKISDIKQVGDYYYFLGDMNTTLGNGSGTYDPYYLKYSLDGKLIESKKLKVSDTVINDCFGYAGKHNDTYYYMVSADLSDNVYSLMLLDKDGFKIFNEEKAKDIEMYFNGDIIVDDYIYGIYEDTTKEPYKEDYYPLGIFKMDFDGNVIKKEVFHYEKTSIWQDMIEIIDNKLYFSGLLYEEDTDYVEVYDKELNYIGESNDEENIDNEKTNLVGALIDDDWYASDVFVFGNNKVEVISHFENEKTTLIIYKK